MTVAEMIPGRPNSPTIMGPVGSTNSSGTISRQSRAFVPKQMSTGGFTTTRCLQLLQLITLILTSTFISAQDAPSFFRTNCYSCHTIGGGRVTGPDLKGVLDRKERTWLVDFIQNPKAVIDSGDSYALDLMKEARNVIMPTIPGLDRSMAEALLDLIEIEGGLEESNFMGLQVSDSPISESDIQQGTLTFTGIKRLENGGPPCISCHSVADTGLLGGGQIGPDLTKVYERLGGRRALATWLMAPASRTMGSVFRMKSLSQDEIAFLSAFLEDHAKNSVERHSSIDATYFLTLGLLGGSLGIGSIAYFWRRRLSGVNKE